MNKTHPVGIIIVIIRYHHHCLGNHSNYLSLPLSIINIVVILIIIIINTMVNVVITGIPTTAQFSLVTI